MITLIHQDRRLPVLGDEDAPGLRPVRGRCRVRAVLGRRERKAGGDDVRHLRRTHPLRHSLAAGGPRQGQVRPPQSASPGFQHRAQHLLHRFPLGRGEQRVEGEPLQVAPEAHHRGPRHRPGRIDNLLADTVPSKGLQGMSFRSEIRVQRSQHGVEDFVENLVAICIARDDPSIGFASGRRSKTQIQRSPERRASARQGFVDSRVSAQPYLSQTLPASWVNEGCWWGLRHHARRILRRAGTAVLSCALP
mmetsp:Transcript_35042/g.91722  ORF Transcript_35042/g.91722 Transcript_35042/m.91722 type:complete len:249 (-) Transcript_35042:489-1235(-)